MTRRARLRRRRLGLWCCLCVWGRVAVFLLALCFCGWFRGCVSVVSCFLVVLSWWMDWRSWVGNLEEIYGG